MALPPGRLKFVKGEPIGIGERIKLVRGDESLLSFADKLGIHKNTLARYEKEESLPDVGLVMRICEVAENDDVTPSWLIEGDGFSPRPSYSSAHQELRGRLNFITTKEEAQDVIDRAGLNLIPEQLLGYIFEKEMLSDLDLVKICKSVAFYEPDLVVSKRLWDDMGITKLCDHVAAINTSKLGELNNLALQDSIEIIEDLAQKNGASIPSSKKSELIALVYEDILHRLDGADRKGVLSRAERMIKLIL